jgi:hypothetical protein
VKKSLNILNFLHRKSECYETKPVHPYLCRAFQKYCPYNWCSTLLCPIFIYCKNWGSSISILIFWNFNNWGISMQLHFVCVFVIVTWWFCKKMLKYGTCSNGMHVSPCPSNAIWIYQIIHLREILEGSRIPTSTLNHIKGKSNINTLP